MTIGEFVKKYLPAAEAVEKSHGINKFLILAQAALESAWGDKAPGNNFFGIKAGISWTGKVQSLLTTEYEDGVAKKIFQPFRAYDSAEECFADYAEVLKKNFPKAAVMSDPIAAAKALVSGKKKYATDPYYAVKIEKIINKLKKEIPMNSIQLDTGDKAEIKIIARGLDNIPHKSILNFDMQPVKLPDAPSLNIGTEQLHEVIDFGVAFGNALIKTFEDGKITIGDIPQFVSPLFKLPSAISGIDQVPAEIEDLTPEELQVEIEFVKEQLDVDNDHAKKIVEAAIKAVYANYLLVKAIKG